MKPKIGKGSASPPQSAPNKATSLRLLRGAPFGLKAEVLNQQGRLIKSSSGTSLRRLLEQVVLFAADEDADAFEFDYKFQSLPDMARRVTVYHNASDKALVTSDLTKGNPDRLGASGPRNSRALPDKVSVVNCEPVISFKEDPNWASLLQA